MYNVQKQNHGLFKDRTGESHVMKNNEKIKIVAYRGTKNVDIVFENGGTAENVYYSNIIKGLVKNKMSPSASGVGFLGNGKYLPNSKAHDHWQAMLNRCYSSKFHKSRPSYIGCSVAKEWHNFQVFAEWFEENYIEGFQLDKDILLKKNKIYSKETCCFVPLEVNCFIGKNNLKKSNLPTGVFKHRHKYKSSVYYDKKDIHVGVFDTEKDAFDSYKIAKEKIIIEIANKFKSVISEKTYQALINYKVEIDD